MRVPNATTKENEKENNSLEKIISHKEEVVATLTCAIDGGMTI